MTLVKAGADLYIRNNDGDTALYCAVLAGHDEVITTLAEAGARRTFNISNNINVVYDTESSDDEYY